MVAPPRQTGAARSLATRLVLSLGSVILGTGLVAGVVLALEDRRTQFDRAIEREQEAAAAFAARLSADIDERIRDVLLLANMEAFTVAGPAQQRMALDQVVTSDTAYAWVGVTDASGIVRAASPSRLLEGTDVSSRPWWDEGRSSLFLGDLHEAELLADALTTADRSVPRFVDIAVPLAGPDDEPSGVLAAHLFWSWTEGLRTEHLAASHGRGGQLLILDASGEVVLPPGTDSTADASPTPRETIGGERGGRIVEWSDGDHVTGWALAGPAGHFDGLGWVVVTRRPVAPLAMHALVLGGQIVAAAMLGALLVAAVAWWRVRLATAQIDAITAAAQRLRDGDETAIPVLDGSREVEVLSAALRELTDHLAERRRELEDRNQQLAEASRARDHFTMMASHEARTPVTTIRGALQTLRQHEDRLTPEARQKLLDAAWRNVQRLERLTSHMLVAAELETGGSAIGRHVDVVVPAHLLRMLAPDHVSVEGPTELRVGVSSSLLELTVGNLLDNAARYGEPPVDVTFGVDGDFLHVRVRDHGPGVPEEFTDRLFARHAQASEGLRRTAVGAGLGLWLSRQLLRATGGDLTHETPDGRGALFTVAIPANRLIGDAAYR